MRRSIATAAVVLAATLSLAACGGGGATTTNQAGAQPAAGAAGGGATQAAAAAGNGGAAAPAGGGAAEVTGQKVGDDDETTGEKIPQGSTVAKAEAAGLGKDGAPVITVTATDEHCTADMNQVPAGKVWFKFVNNGKKINELYLEDTKGTEMIEVEKIRSGQSGAFSKKVAAGAYQIACAPGMGNTQIRTPLTVQ